MSAWFAIAALAWQAIRTTARTRRLEHLTHAWLVAGSATNVDQRRCEIVDHAPMREAAQQRKLA